MDSQTALLVFAILTSAFFGAAINESMWRWYEWRKTKRRAGITASPAIKGATAPTLMQQRLTHKSVWRSGVNGVDVVVENVSEYIVGCSYLTNRSVTFTESINGFLRAYTFMAPDESYLAMSSCSALTKSRAQLISLLTPSLSLPLMEMTSEQLKVLRRSFGLDEYAPPEQDPVDAQAAIDAAEEAFADPAKKGMI